MLLLICFKINFFLKKIFQEYHQNVKQFGPGRFVGPDLSPNCLPSLSEDDTGRQSVKHGWSYNFTIAILKFCLYVGKIFKNNDILLNSYLIYYVILDFRKQFCGRQ